MTVYKAYERSWYKLYKYLKVEKGEEQSSPLLNNSKATIWIRGSRNQQNVIKPPAGEVFALVPMLEIWARKKSNFIKRHVWNCLIEWVVIDVNQYLKNYQKSVYVQRQSCQILVKTDQDIQESMWHTQLHMPCVTWIILYHQLQWIIRDGDQNHQQCIFPS